MRKRLVILIVLAAVAVTDAGWARATDVPALRQVLAKGADEQAVAEVRALAEKGDARAQDLLGDLFLAGRGVIQNLSLAFNAYERAAVQGLAPAQYKVGFMTATGRGAIVAPKQALKWYDFALHQDYYPAEVRAALQAETVYGANHPKTLAYLEAAARRGSVQSARRLRRIAERGNAAAARIVDRLPGALTADGAIAPPPTGGAADKGIAALLRGDSAEAMAILKPLADRDDPGGLFGLGLIYDLGVRLAIDRDRAAAYYRKAAAKGDAAAQFNLGRLALLGAPGRLPDRAAAERWFEMAKKDGSAEAERALSALGRGLYGTPPAILVSPANDDPNPGIRAFAKRDYAAALAWFKAAADRDEAAGLFGLGLLYDTGVGWFDNLGRARAYYEAAAASGIPPARVNLARLHGMAAGRDATSPQAVAEYVKAAEDGDAVAQLILGTLYLAGRGVPHDLSRARRWLDQATAQGSARAENALAVALFADAAAAGPSSGGHRVPFRLSAPEGYATAEAIRRTIEVAVGPEIQEPAIDHLRKAAAKGDADAAFNLGALYRARGGGFENAAEAYAWFTLAQDRGQPAAKAARADIAAAMPADQVLRAEWRVLDRLRARVPTVSVSDPADDTRSVEELVAQAGKLLSGKPSTRDYDRALALYRNAAGRGDAVAQRRLGYMYRRGLGAGANDFEAANWYRKAAEQGLAKAQRDLGIMYQFGRGVPQDDVEAVKWYRKAAEQGDAKAQGNLGFMYRVGRGVAQDYRMAATLYHKAAVQGSSRGQWSLGKLYQLGKGVPQDDEEAVKWFEMSAKQGNRKAQADLGFMYKSGRGVWRDYDEAAKWYRRAADQGLARAQYVLGLMYVDGVGVETDDAAAVKWLTLAVEQGHEKADDGLDDLVKDDRGQPKDFEKFAKLCAERAFKGNPRFQNSLGLLYWFGKGVPKDRAKAEEWFRRAVKKKYKKAADNLKELKGER